MKAEPSAVLARRPIPRTLAALALVLAVAALVARGLSSGAGQALESPASVLVLDTLCLLAGVTAIAARFLAKEPVVAVPASVLAPLGVFLAVSGVAALHGAEPMLGRRTAFSWAALAALGLAVHDVARKPGAARMITGAIAGTAAGASLLALYELVFEYPLVQKLLREKGPLAMRDLGLPLEMYEPMRWRVEDAMATGPYLLPSHLATALALVTPVAIAATVLAWRRRRDASAAVALAVLAVADIIIICGIACARSKGATLALGATVAAFAWLAIPRASRVWRRRVGGAVAVGLALVLAAAGVKYARSAESFGLGMSLQVRLEYWAAALSMARAAPLAGQGLETYATEYSAHRSARAEDVRHAHQDVLELFAEEGIAGPIAFLWLVVALGLAGARAVRGAQEAPAPPKQDPDVPARLPPEVALPVGVALGCLWLGSAGDRFNAGTPGHIFAGAIVAIAVAWAVSAALAGEERETRALVGAAGIAGALAFFVDGLTDFPLHVHGLVGSALALAALGPALARGESEPPAAAPPPARGVAALAVVALTLVGLIWTPLLSRDDAARKHGMAQIALADRVIEKSARPTPGLSEDERELAVELLDRTPPEVRDLLTKPVLTRLELHQIALALLDDGTRNLRALHEDSALGAPDILSLVQAEDMAGRLGRDPKRLETIVRELDFAVKHRPHGFALWSEYGRWLAKADRLEEATRAFDEASRLFPGNPRGHLDAGAVRVARIVDGAPFEGELRSGAVRELEEALRLANASRLERLHLDAADVAVARSLLASLGAAPREPGP